jgi:hypothetical protein
MTPYIALTPSSLSLSGALHIIDGPLGATCGGAQAAC